MLVQLRFHAQIAVKLGMKEAYLEFEENITWSQLFSRIEQLYELSLFQGVFTIIDGKSIWNYREQNKQIGLEAVTIEVFPALAGG